MGVIISILDGKSVKDISKSIGEDLKTEEKIKALKKDFQQKKNNWKASKNNLSAQISKYNNFKFEKDLKKLINQIKGVKKDYKATKNQIKTFQSDIKKFEREIKELKKVIKNDQQKIKKLGSIPTLDVKKEINNLLLSFLEQQYAPYIKQLNP